MTAVDEQRPLRSDAAANRELIIKAAFEAFAQHGPEASVEDIARRAGVGIGTLYRRFPTKTALSRELSVLLIEHTHSLAAQALEKSPRGEALESFVFTLCEQRSKYGQALVWLYGLESREDTLRDIREVIRQMIADAKVAGQIREELEPNDLSLLLWAVQGVSEMTRDVAPDTWRRLVETVFAGWRPSPERPLRTPPISDEHWSLISAAQQV